MNQTIQNLATRTTHALHNAHARGHISDTRTEDLSRTLARLASMLDKGEINAAEYMSDVTHIGECLGA